MLYSLVHINETSPYEVFAYKEDTVYFITDDGSEYLVGFIEETNIGIQRAYQLFIIKKRNGIHIGTDVKIGRTVSSIVHSFFRNSSISSSMKSTVWIDCRYCLPYIVGIRCSILVRCRKILPGIGPPVRFRTGSCSLL